MCGSIEAFLAEPSKLGQSGIDPNFSWMRPVSAEEGQRSLARMLAWARSDKPPSGGTLGEWLFGGSAPAPPVAVEVDPPQPLMMGQTPGTAQRGWTTPSEFPSCPAVGREDPLVAYAANLAPGAVFSRNRFSESIVAKSALVDDGRSLWVMCAYHDELELKPWSLAQVTFEDGLFVHTSRGAFFGEARVEKQFTLAQGLEWTGGDSIDDYA